MKKKTGSSKKRSSFKKYVFQGIVAVAATISFISFIKIKDSNSAGCAYTGFYRDGVNLTAALINPPKTVTGDIDASGCNIGIYFGPGAKGYVNKAKIHGATYFGIVNHKGNVDVVESAIYAIGENPFNGTQHGVGIYYATVDSPATGTICSTGGTSGEINGNEIYNYQKGGIVANCSGTSVRINNNKVIGQGPVTFIAQNGIQVGYGAAAFIKGNKVEGNAYMGSSTVSAGILAVGGPYYGGADYTTNIQIVDNSLYGNDVGVYLSNLSYEGTAPKEKTNIKVVNNAISKDTLTNNYGGVGYQAGVADVGNNDKIINNNISGSGYDPASNTGAAVFAVDADKEFTNKPKVHANR